MNNLSWFIYLTQLVDIVHAQFTDWDEDGPRSLRQFNGPSDIFRAAQEIINERVAATKG